MESTLVLAETQTSTSVFPEATDPDRESILAETHSLTEVRGEASDPDRGAALAETIVGSWKHGNNRPLLFRGAITATDKATQITYDPALEVTVNCKGRPLVLSEILAETMTETAVRTESDDRDR